MQGRLKAARKEDDGDAEMAEEFGQFMVPDLHAETVRAGEHTEDEEEQHARNAVLGAEPRNEDGGEHQDGQEQQDVPGSQVDGYGRQDGQHGYFRMETSFSRNSGIGHRESRSTSKVLMPA